MGSRTLKLKGNLDAHLLNRTHLVLDLTLLVVFTYRSIDRYSIPQCLSFSLNYIRVIEDSDKTNHLQPYLSLNQFSLYVYIVFTISNSLLTKSYYSIQEPILMIPQTVIMDSSWEKNVKFKASTNMSSRLYICWLKATLECSFKSKTPFPTYGV